MAVRFDPAKDTINRRKHGISLKRANDFDFFTAKIEFDDREQYGEDRYRALGFLDAEIYMLVYTPQKDGVRAISLRRATPQERRDYAEER